MDKMDEDSFCRSNNRDFTDPFAFQNYRFDAVPVSQTSVGVWLSLPV